MRKPATAGAVNWYPGIGTLDSDSTFTPEGQIAQGNPTEADNFTVHTALLSEGSTELNTLDVNGASAFNGSVDFAGTVTFLDTIGFSRLATFSEGFATVSQTKVSNLNSDFLDGYTTATVGTASTVPVTGASGKLDTSFIPATDINLSGSIDFHEDFFQPSNTSTQAIGNTVRAAGQNNWTISGFSKGTTTTNPVRAWGGLSLVLPGDSNRVGLVFMQADSSRGGAGLHGRGGWLSFLGNSPTREGLFPALPVGATITIGISPGANLDSLVTGAGIVTMPTNGLAFALNDSTKPGLWFEFGKKSVNGADSIYAVTCNGTAKTKQGIMLQTASRWYRATIAVNSATSVTFSLRDASTNYATATSRTITTTLPSATGVATPVLGVWSYSADSPLTVLKSSRFDYFTIKKVGGIR
jgi:hypothetical protein